MSPAALSLPTFVSLALAANVVLGQVTGTYPPVPLASKHFTYPSGIVCSFFLGASLESPTLKLNVYSRIKSTQTKVLFVVPKSDTTSAILRPKTKIRSAKLQFSMAWMVRAFFLLLAPLKFRPFSKTFASGLLASQGRPSVKSKAR